METRRPFLPPDTSKGKDPDYRYSLANERTFLAWIRTALALNGGGLAVVSLLPQFARIGREVVGTLLITLGTLLAARSFGRWRSNEEAMRTGATIRPSRLPGTLALGVTVTTLVALALLLADTNR